MFSWSQRSLAHRHFRGAEIRAGRDVEEVADLVEQNVFALHLADILAQSHYPIRLAALAWLVAERPRPRTAVEAPLADDALVCLEALPLLAGDLVPRRSFQPLPRLRPRRGCFQPKMHGPPVEVRGHRVASCSACGSMVPIDPLSRIRVARYVARAVNHVEHFLGVGQRHDQRGVS